MRPTLLFHVQHFLGMGHLVRAFELARSLAGEFRVVVASGGRFPPGIEPPAGVEVVELPALGFDVDRALVSHATGRNVDEVLHMRRQMLLALHDALCPDVVLIELFPFGRKKLAGELMPLLERTRTSTDRPLVATSVRDILVTGRHDQQRHDDRAAHIAEQFVDVVLVHGDRRFMTLDDSFRPRQPLSVPIEYTGFVAPAPNRREAPRGIAPGGVVVSAGGGWVGGALMRAAIEASPMFAARHGLHTTVITGPLVDEADWHGLQDLATNHPTAHLVRSVPGLLPTLRQAAVSISQAGYNTMMDLLHAQVPAVLVPFGDESENEQPRRAQQLAAHGLAHVVDPTLQSAKTLADAVSRAIADPPRPTTWNVDGADTSTAILRQALNERRTLVA